MRIHNLKLEIPGKGKIEWETDCFEPELRKDLKNAVRVSGLCEDRCPLCTAVRKVLNGKDGNGAA